MPDISSNVRTKSTSLRTDRRMASSFFAAHGPTKTTFAFGLCFLIRRAVSDASVDGRNFAVSGGVAKSVENVIREKYPDREIKMANAEGLKECRKLLTMAKAGKYNGYLLEGMACPGGCVAGAGTMQSIKKSQAAVNKYAAQAKHKISSQTEYVKELDKLVD